MKNTLQKHAQLRNILIRSVLFVVNLALFSLPGVPGSTPSIVAAAPNLTPPDMMGLYSPQAVNTFLEAIGPAGREAYHWMHLTLDLAFPLIYGSLICLVLARQVGSNTSAGAWLPWLGLAAAIADLLENFILLYITDHFPAPLPGLAMAAQVFTLLKFGLIIISLMVAAVLGIQKRQHNRKPSKAT